MKLLRRFWSKVAQTGNVCECWEWTACKNAKGYGRFAFPGGSLAHRFSYQIAIGPIRVGLEIDHLCGNRSCVNPWHLEPVAHSENLARADVSAHWRNKTHCPVGHPYDEENTVIYGGSRFCRACAKARSAAFYANKKAKLTA